MINYWMLHKIKGVCKNHIENLKNSTNAQTQALTAEQAKVEQDKTQAEHHKANAQQRQTVEQTMPVTAQFHQEEEKRLAEEIHGIKVD